MAVLAVVLLLAYLGLVALVIRRQRRRTARRHHVVNLTDGDVASRRLNESRANRRRARQVRGDDE
jgi:hypothetical protein